MRQVLQHQLLDPLQLLQRRRWLLLHPLHEQRLEARALLIRQRLQLVPREDLRGRL